MPVLFLVHNEPQNTVVYLESPDGGPAEGLTASDVSVSIRKSSDYAFEPKAISVNDFNELEGGFYSLALHPDDVDTLGSLYVRIMGSKLRTYLLSAYVAESVPTVPPTAPVVTTTTLYGFLLKPNGSALANASVSVRILSQPTILHSGDDGVGLATDAVTTRSDSSGFFSVEAVTGVPVELTIPAINYRRTLVVPGSSSNVFDIP